MVEEDLRVHCVLDITMFPVGVPKDGSTESHSIVNSAEVEGNDAWLKTSLARKPL
jgi:hypothetical protein